MSSRPTLNAIRTQSQSNSRIHPYPLPISVPTSAISSTGVTSGAISATTPDSLSDALYTLSPIESRENRPRQPRARGPKASQASASTSGAAGAGSRGTQPKSNRKQFSACGACQLRQVKCDLKDKIQIDGEKASCTACLERGVNCVNVYSQDAKPKAQRKGRRLAVVEKVYGKAGNRSGDEQDTDMQAAIHAIAGTSASGGKVPSNRGVGRDTNTGPSKHQTANHDSEIGSRGVGNQGLSVNKKSCIPALQPEFLESSFYRSFHTQRPIVDPREFRSRFEASLQGDHNALGPVGSVISLILVTWAASYGIDEYGREEAGSPVDFSSSPSSSKSGPKADFAKRSPPGSGYGGSPRLGVGNANTPTGASNLLAVRKRRARCNEMVREILDLIDRHALLRRPSWDGVRVLMLVMPLTEDCLTPVDRLSMYQSTISQIYNLCTLGTALLGIGGDKMVVARIFWYAYVHEGITSGLRGRKLIFDDDDLRVFEATLPKFRAAGEGGLAVTTKPVSDSYAFRFSTAPIRLSTACRQINYALTGPKASLRQDIDEKKLNDGWETLANCWLEFESLREMMSGGAGGFMHPQDMERFISGWQIFLFECHNVIRESLKEKLIDHNVAGKMAAAHIVEMDDYTLEQQNGASTSNIQRLLDLAESNCRDLHTRVMELIRQQLDSPSFFQFDASLVRDGTFYAGNWACHDGGSETDVHLCIRALEKMRWAFSAGETRIETLRFAWNNRQRQSPHGTRTPPRNGTVPAFRDQAILSEMHLPIGPGTIAGMGQDSFEHYLFHESAVEHGTFEHSSSTVRSNAPPQIHLDIAAQHAFPSQSPTDSRATGPAFSQTTLFESLQLPPLTMTNIPQVEEQTDTEFWYGDVSMPSQSAELPIPKESTRPSSVYDSPPSGSSHPSSSSSADFPHSSNRSPNSHAAYPPMFDRSVSFEHEAATWNPSRTPRYDHNATPQAHHSYPAHHHHPHPHDLHGGVSRQTTPYNHYPAYSQPDAHIHHRHYPHTPTETPNQYAPEPVVVSPYRRQNPPNVSQMYAGYPPRSDAPGFATMGNSGDIAYLNADAQHLNPTRMPAEFDPAYYDHQKRQE